MVAEMKKLDSLSKQIEQYESHLKMVHAEINNAVGARDKAREENKAFRDDSDKRKTAADNYCEVAKAQVAEERKAFQAEKDRHAQDRQQLNLDRNDLASCMTGVEMEKRKLAVDRQKVDAYFNEIKKLAAGW